MEVNCEGCAGCCVDWRPLVADPPDHERRGRYRPLDDTYNLVPLSSDEVRRFLADGYGDALIPRLFAAERGITVDGHTLAAIGGRPAFYVGLRKFEKPVGPFGVAAEPLPTCAFLDPETLQCRIHGTDGYPESCATYPGDNLALDVETECERVEARFGGDRLLDDDPPGGAGVDQNAVGATVFAHPDPGDLSGRVRRIARGEATDEDRAAFVSVAAASHPGSLAVDDARREQAHERVIEADSWISRITDAEFADPGAASDAEESWGAPPTPGWD